MIRRERATATAVALLAAVYNVAVNRVLPPATHVPANLLAAAFGTALGRTAAHASWSELGLGREQLRRGLVMGGAVSLAAAGVVGAAAVTPSTRRFFVDERVHEVSPAEAAYEVGVRIPLATALPEEVVFRGVLLGVLQRSHTATTSIAWTSTLFGLWHLLPTLNTMHSNPISEELPNGRAGQAVALGAATLATGATGVALGLLRNRSGGVLAPFLVHATLNATAYVCAHVVVSRRPAVRIEG